MLFVVKHTSLDLNSNILLSLSHLDCSVSIPPFVINVNGIAGPLEVGFKILRIYVFELPIKTGTSSPLSTTPSISQKIAGIVIYFGLAYFFIFLEVYCFACT